MYTPGGFSGYIVLVFSPVQENFTTSSLGIYYLFLLFIYYGTKV